MRRFISQLYEFCPNLSLIVTSNKSLGSLENNVHPETMIISRLKDD